MLLACLFLVVVGAAVTCMGILIWKKQKITAIHSYHYARVKEQDKPAYTRRIGKGVAIIGLGVALTGVVNYLTGGGYGWLCFCVGFAVGFGLIVTAQRKYNGGMF